MEVSIIGGADGPTSIFLAGRIGSRFLIPAILIMILFYGIYFAKMIRQRCRGIQTDQLGRGKDKRVRLTECVLKAATVFIVPVQLLSILWDWSFLPYGLRVSGIVIGLLGDLVFLLSVVAMKDSWRAGIPDEGGTQFVCHGIYRYSRNPAFVGFDMMYAGILLLYFNWLLLFFTIWAVAMLHWQILQEEKYLEKEFGEKYLEYKRQVRRY